MSWIADVESDGLLAELTRIHCLVLRHTTSNEVRRYRRNDAEDNIEEGLRFVMDCGELIVPHNGIKFDVPAIQKVYPWFHLPAERILDTLVLARAIYPDIKKSVDARLVVNGTLPKQLFGRHSLEAWGHRLGFQKGDFKGPWDKWTQEMEDYCVQDTAVTLKLLDTLTTSKTGRLWFEPAEAEAIRLEHAVQEIVARQERYGFLFDTALAAKLYSTLVQKKLELESELVKVFPPFYLGGKEKTPPKDRKGTPEYMKLAEFAGNKQLGFCAGAPYLEVELVDFNPGSRDHVAIALKRRYSWEPTEFTDDGKAKIDETVLGGLTYPEAKLLAEYFTVVKRIGQVATGKEAWLKKVEKDGRIRGSVITNGAVTGRMTHAYPNMAQVPASRSPYGHECRALFIAGPGRILVGADADALELRCLAHFMARFDDGDYVRVVLEGKKEAGTDIHSVNARALGMDPKANVLDGWTGRDLAKTWFYAFIYGAGDEKLGLILTGKKGPKAKKVGAKSRKDFMQNLPALGKLVTAVREAVAKRGYLRGLDGRILSIRSQHAALNTLLQSAGAVLMKKALVILDRRLQSLGLVPGVDYEFVANVHDEWQIETLPQHGETIGKAAAESIGLAGQHFNFRCPLAGSHSTGRSWAETH